MRVIVKFWRSHGTKILGYITTTIPTVMLIEGLIPDAHEKYYLLALALLGGATVKRGHTNTKRTETP